MNLLFILINECIASNEIFLSPWNFPLLNLSIFKHNNKEFLQFIDVENIKNYNKQDRFEKPKGYFSFINKNDDLYICNKKNSNLLKSCSNYNKAVKFEEKFFLSKKGSFFVAFNKFCLTLGNKDNETHGFNLVLDLCTYNDNQKFSITSAPVFNENLFNSDRIIKYI